MAITTSPHPELKDGVLQPCITEVRKFKLIATDQHFEHANHFFYLDTFMFAGGDFVFHLFEVTA